MTACTGNNGGTQAAESTSSAVVQSPVPSSPTLKATSTRTIRATQTPAKPARTAKATITPTIAETLTLVEAAAEIDLLLEDLVADLEDTEIIQEAEIP